MKAFNMLLAFSGRRVLDFPTGNLKSSSTRDLEADARRFDGWIQEVLPAVVEVPPQRDELVKFIRYFSDLHEKWERAKFGICTLDRIGEIEKSLGTPLLATKGLDLPPYAEALAQSPFLGLAYRHPEYMLSRDLKYSYALYRQSEKAMEAIDWRQASSADMAGSECNLTLGRMTILSCFNLLESFISGLAQTHLYYHAGRLHRADQEALEDTRRSLRSRVLEIPKILTSGRFVLPPANPSLRALFDDIKKRRDAYVHCQPGDKPNNWGTIKERLFHDVKQSTVDEAVNTTHDLIATIWTGVYSKTGPHWLFCLPLSENHCPFVLRRSSHLATDAQKDANDQESPKVQGRQ